MLTPSINEIVQHKMLYDRNPQLRFYEDKYYAKVFAYFCGVPVVPLLYHCDTSQKLATFLMQNQSSMPDFVVKTNHGCGDFLIARRLQKDIWLVRNVMNKKVTGTFSEITALIANQAQKALRIIHRTDEWAVAMVWPRRLLVEPYIALNDDYKVMTSRGSAIFTYCCTARDTEIGLASGVFDREWRFRGALEKCVQKYGREQINLLLMSHFRKPDNLDVLHHYAEALCPADIRMQRIDFYMTQDHEFLLGEITAYSGRGTTSIPDEIGRELAELEARAVRPAVVRACDVEPMAIDRTTCAVFSQGEETLQSESALRRAFYAVARGFETVLHVPVGTPMSAVADFVKHLKRNSVKSLRHGSIWSWHHFEILSEIERRIVDKKLVARPC